MPRLELVFLHSAIADGSNVGRLLASSRFRFTRDVRMIAYLASIHAPAWRATLSIIDIRPGRAEAERKVIADVQKIVAIWNARQAGGLALWFDPTIAAIAADVPWLSFSCPACGQKAKR
jgi:hypothetical protein